MADREPRVVSGTVIACRFFDVADTIDLTRAEALWARHARPASTRGRLASTPPKAVAFGVPPLEVPMAPALLRFDSVEIPAHVSARLYDFGVARLALQVPTRDLSWTDFTRTAIALDRSVGPRADLAIWTELLAQLRALFAEAFDRPSARLLEEDYLIGVVRAFDATPDAEALLNTIDLVPLLSGEVRPLADGARRDILRQRFSYYADDLVVLTWDRAFLYEPRGDSDVMDVLEVANAQLLEMRYYDQLLDAELPRMYHAVEAMRHASRLFASRRFADLARGLYTLVAEVTELREKVDNALQVTEDVYLARVYAAALDQFRVPEVSASVDRKLAIIRDTYAALYEEASAGRAALMEAAIVVLIVVEVILALLRF
jgi:hypothetical protein